MSPRRQICARTVHWSSVVGRRATLQYTAVLRSRLVPRKVSVTGQQLPQGSLVQSHETDVAKKGTQYPSCTVNDGATSANFGGSTGRMSVIDSSNRDMKPTSELSHLKQLNKSDSHQFRAQTCDLLPIRFRPGITTGTACERQQ